MQTCLQSKCAQSHGAWLWHCNRRGFGGALNKQPESLGSSCVWAWEAQSGRSVCAGAPRKQPQRLKPAFDHRIRCERCHAFQGMRDLPPHPSHNAGMRTLARSLSGPVRRCVLSGAGSRRSVQVQVAQVERSSAPPALFADAFATEAESERAAAATRSPGGPARQPPCPLRACTAAGSRQAPAQEQNEQGGAGGSTARLQAHPPRPPLRRPAAAEAASTSVRTLPINYAPETRFTVDSPADADAQNFRLDPSVPFWQRFRTRLNARNMESLPPPSK